MRVFVVLRFDPKQCGACGIGSLDKIFKTVEEANAYVKSSRNRPGVSWEIKEHIVDIYPA